MSSAHLDKFCGSKFWDANLTWYTPSPDFTPCFERTCLVWTQSLVLFLFSPIDIYYIIKSKNSYIPWNWRNISKMLIALVMIGISMFDFCYSLAQKNQHHVPQVDIWTPVFRLMSVVFALVLMFLHRKRGQVRSGLLFCYWLLVFILGMPQFRTDLHIYRNDKNWPVPVSLITYMVYYLLNVIILLLNFIADLQPSDTKYQKVDVPSPEETASFPSRILFTWFDSFALLGYRRPVEEKDLANSCYEDMTSEVIPMFEGYWKEALKKNKGKFIKNKDGKQIPQPTSILGPISKAFGSTFIFGGFCKLVNDLLTFVSPQILKYLVQFCAGNEYSWRGYVYAVALFVVAEIQTLFVSQYFMKMYTVGIRIRTSLTASIYRKALIQSGAARKDSTLGEIVNLMAVDAQRFMDLTAYLHMIWSAPLQIILSVYFLYGTLGPSVFAGLGAMVILIPVNGFIVTKLRSFQIQQMKAKDERVKTMNEILSGIKVLKLYAWDPSFEQTVLKIRGKELSVLKSAAYYSGGISFVWTCAPFLVSFVSFAVYLLSDDKHLLDPATAFVSISLFNILRAPLSLLPMLVTNMVQTGVSVGRINRFMNGEDIDESTVTHDTSESDPIVVENGSFAWGGPEKPALKNINLRIKKGSLVAVVGTVGASKSSLLCSILGEMKKLSGRVNVHGKIAYVPQLAWIQNTTLKDNILFGRQLDSKRYWKVIDSCALGPDLKILPAGDQTEIGEKGINLSGGQKQRVSLARAVYTDSDTYLLDDPLSAVDSHVGKHIFENVIGPQGLLSGKTRILVTHGLTYLPEVDMIVVLKDGSISEMGTYKELLANKGDFNSLVISQQMEFEKDPEEELDMELGEMDTVSEMEVTLGRENSIRKRGDSVTRRKSSARSSISVRDPKFGEKLIEIEKKEIGKVKWAVYFRYFHSIGVTMSAIILAFSIIYQAFSVSSSLILSKWTSDPNYLKGDIGVRNMYLEVYAGLGVGQFVSTFIFSILLALGCVGASKRIHHDFLYRIMRAPMSFFDTTPIGRIINLFSKDLDIIDNLIPMNIQTVLLFFFTVLATIFIISYSTPIFISVIIPMFAIYYFIQRFYIATSRQLKRLESVSRSPIYSHFGESVTGAISIRAYGEQKRFIQESEDKVDFNQRCSYPNLVANRWLAVRLETVGNLIIFFSALFAVIERDSIDPGLVGLSISYSLQITQILNWLVRMTSDVETNIVSVERIKDYDKAPQEAAWEITPSQAPKGWPHEGHVEFKNFEVRYRDGLDLVLRGINFHTGTQEKVGIVGRTGAGKSSMTLCLFRIIEAAGGSILIDGVDISKLGLLELRSRLTIIPQDPVLFSGSLRINLDPFGRYNDDELWAALENAHLKSFVRELSAGLNHEITEGGDNLSVGQRQLVCLARALLRKTKVLILDEATAAIDLETDELIQRTIRTEFASCTVLTIAHRINTIMDSDRVMVLDKGQIVEFDSPSTLIKSKSSIFFGMAHDAGLV